MRSFGTTALAILFSALPSAASFTLPLARRVASAGASKPSISNEFSTLDESTPNAPCLQKRQLYYAILSPSPIRRFQLAFVLAFRSIQRMPPPSLRQLPALSYYSKTNDIQVSVVTTNEDITSLADLRYDEWMRKDPNPPKLSNFRLATSEIYHESKREGSTVFLATIMSNTSNNHRYTTTTVVGAAELSPVELKGVFTIAGKNAALFGNVNAIISEAMPLYVTDVVTSSAHRRLGIGSKLMDAAEKTAREMGSRFQFLHVEHDNIGARTFYERLGYVTVDIEMVQGEAAATTNGNGIILFSHDDGEFVREPLISTTSNGNGSRNLIAMDCNRLAVNAGTVGQLLMMKQLASFSTSPPKIARGFGSGKLVERSKKKKKK